jgi:hypothetical protein
MGSKRKNTADGMPAPSRVRRSEAAPTPALIPLAVEEPSPPASSAMVPSHQTEDGGRLLVQASAAEEEVLEVVRLTERYMPKKLLHCDECHVPLKAPISQVNRTIQEQNLHSKSIIPCMHPGLLLFFLCITSIAVLPYAAQGVHRLRGRRVPSL